MIKTLKISKRIAPLFLIFIFALLLAPAVLAVVPGEPVSTGINTPQEVYNAINRVAKFLFNAFLGLAVILLIVAALFYLAAAGNQTQLDRAKNILIYSIVAIVIALVAGGVTSFIKGIILP